MLSVLLLGFGSAMAATSAIDNLPGGAGVIYFQAGSSWQTLVNIQSTFATGNMTVHVTIYDMNSVDLLDFEVPLTKYDNMGFSITGDGASTCTIVPYSDNAFSGSGIPAAGLTFSCPNIGSLQYGYIGLVLDNITAAAVDPTTVGSWTRTNFVNPDLLVMRAALIRGTDAAFAINATMIQGFANMMTPGSATVGLSEANAAGFEQFINTFGADALCTGVAVDWNNAAGTQFITIDDPAIGPNIDSWELYATDNSTVFALNPLLIADGAAAGGAACTRNGRYKVLGSADNFYWGRYNATPSMTASTLIMVFPASPGTAAGTADPRAAGSVIVKAFNDDETPVSTALTPLEVHRIGAGTPGFNIISSAGELLIDTATPMYGWVYTESAGFADVYPLVRDRINIVSTNLFEANDTTGFFIPDPGAATTSNVLSIP